jgi:hypothetical protein
MFKWRAKHARRVAKRTPYVPTPFTIDEWTESLVPGPDEFAFRINE